MKVYAVVSLDKAEGVLNDCSLYAHREDAIRELEEIMLDIDHPVPWYDGEYLVGVTSDDWAVQIYEREIQ